MDVKKSSLSLLTVLFALSLGARPAEEPLTEKTRGITPRTPIFIRNDTKEDISFSQTAPRRIDSETIQPGDRKKIVEIDRVRPLSGQTSKDYDWKGSVTLPNGKKVNLHVQLKNGKLAFSVLDQAKTEMRNDLYPIEKPKGQEERIFGSSAIVVDFYSHLQNMGYHTIEFWIKKTADLPQADDDEEENDNDELEDEQEEDVEENGVTPIELD